MKTLFLVRFRLFMMLIFCLLIPVGCSTTGHTSYGSWLDLRKEDLSKIYVNGFSSASNLQLPSEHDNALYLLQYAVEHELFLQGRLQVENDMHTLTLQGVILSYQDGVFDLQGELYNDDEFLVYSRVRRHLDINDDWEQGINLIAKQLLDELMFKMSLKNFPPIVTFPDSHPEPAPELPGDVLIFDIFVDGGDHGHKKNSEKSSVSVDKPKPKPHLIPDAVIESLPRTMHVSEELMRRKHEIERQNELRESTGSSSLWDVFGGQSGAGASTSSSSPSNTDHTPSVILNHEPSSSSEKPTRSYIVVPRSNNVDHQRRASEASTLVAEPVTSKETKSSNNDSASSGRGSYSGSAPRSQKH